MIFNKLKNSFSTMNKKPKRITSILLTALLAINGVGTSKVAFAKDNQPNNAQNKYTIIEHGNYINVMGNSGKFLSYQTQLKETKEDGTLAYCLEYGKPGPGSNGAEYLKGNELRADIRDGITYIIRSNPNTGNRETDYAIRQGAVHYFLGQLNWINDVTYGVKNRDMIVDLVNKAKNAKSITKENISLNIGSKDNKFILNGDKYETDWYNISSKGELESYTLEVKNAPKGTEIINQNGKVVKNLNTSDTKFKLRVPKANVTGEHEMTVSVKGNFFVGVASQYVTVDDRIQKMGMLFEDHATAEDSFKAKLTAPGSLHVLKKGEDGKVLAGAKFKLQQNGVDVTKEKLTDENGRVGFTDLVPGEYTLVETEAPNGYLVSDKQEKIQIKTGETEYIEVINNVKKGILEFSKTDVATGEIIEGAKIEIQGLSETNKNVKVEFVSSKEGNKFELPIGEYEFKEIQAPNGYLLSEEVGHFEIKENGQVVKAELKNDVKKGTLEFSKRDVSTGEIIEGAKIQITGLSETNKNIKLEFVSNKEGNKFELPVGEYEFKEIEAPEGYVLSEEIGHFEIKENGEIVKAELTNERITSTKNKKPKAGSPNDDTPPNETTNNETTTNKNTNSEKPVVKNTNTGNPITGDKGIMSLGLVAMVALGGLVAVNRRKKISKIK